MDRFQKWKLCPVCGHAYEVAKVPAYLQVEDYHDAEHIIRQMEKHLHANKKKDFTPKSPRNCAGIMPSGLERNVTKTRFFAGP